MSLPNLRILHTMLADLRNHCGELADRIRAFELLISESADDIKAVYEYQMASVKTEREMANAEFVEISAVIEKLTAIRSRYK